MDNNLYCGNYVKIPKRKDALLTREFLIDFKMNIIEAAIANDKRHKRKAYSYLNESFYGFYSSIAGTGLFYDALLETCKYHNVVKAIYEYCLRMPWYDSDCFEGDILFKMVTLNIIPKENEFDSYVPEPDEVKYSLTRHFGNYSVSEYGYWYKDNKKALENIYSDTSFELAWVE